MSEGKRAFVSYEYKEISVNGAYLSNYLDGYESFGWHVDREPGGPDMRGKVTLHLKRERHVLNKAELTRLQRQFEACMAAIQALEASKQSRATMVALSVALAGTAFMAGSTFAVTAEPPIIWLCVLLAIPGFLGWVAAYFVYRWVLQKRADEVAPLIEMKYDEMEETCRKGSELMRL